MMLLHLVNCKPDESFRVALSWPATQFRLPLANRAKGYEERYGVIHLETFTDNESEDELEVVSALTGGYEFGEVRNYDKNVH